MWAGSLTVAPGSLLSAAVALIVVALCWLFANRAALGDRLVAAMSEDGGQTGASEHAAAHLYALAYAAAAAAAGVIGSLLSLTGPFTSGNAYYYSIIAVVVGMLGGLGSVTGALFAALAVGLVQGLLGPVAGGRMDAASTLGLLLLAILLRSMPAIGPFLRRRAHLLRGIPM